MFAITGITGNVGGELARTLLAAKQPVGAVVRDLGKGAPGRSADATSRARISGRPRRSRQHSKESKESSFSSRRTSILSRASRRPTRRPVPFALRWNRRVRAELSICRR